MSRIGSWTGAMTSTNRSDAHPRGRPGSGHVHAIAKWLHGGLDDAATGMMGVAAILRPSRKANLVEQADGTFIIDDPGGRAAARGVDPSLDLVGTSGGLSAAARRFLSGSEIELALLPRRFLFRTLDLPRRAADFLDGVVRTQIDRLTPWAASEAVFGWSQPSMKGNDRIEVVVAAAARETITPLVAALGGLNARSWVLSTAEAGSTPGSRIVMPLDRTGAASPGGRLKGRLSALAVGALLLFGLSVAASAVLEGRLEAERDELDRTIAERAAARSGNRGSAADAALAASAAKKQSTPAIVIVLETLAKALPDHTYLTDLHIEHGTVQIGGVTHDAPALIRLIEQSHRFTRARFSAPTMKSAGDSSERFHIEAQIAPVAAASR